MTGTFINVSGAKKELKDEKIKHSRTFDGLNIVLRSHFHQDKLKAELFGNNGKDDLIKSKVDDKVKDILKNNEKDKAKGYELLNNDFDVLFKEETFGSEGDKIKAHAYFNKLKEHANVVGSSSGFMLGAGKGISWLSQAPILGHGLAAMNSIIRMIPGKLMGDMDANNPKDADKKGETLLKTKSNDEIFDPIGHATRNILDESGRKDSGRTAIVEDMLRHNGDFFKDLTETQKTEFGKFSAEKMKLVQTLLKDDKLKDFAKDDQIGKLDDAQVKQLTELLSSENQNVIKFKDNVAGTKETFAEFSKFDASQMTATLDAIKDKDVPQDLKGKIKAFDDKWKALGGDKMNAIIKASKNDKLPEAVKKKINELDLKLTELGDKFIDGLSGIFSEYAPKEGDTPEATKEAKVAHEALRKFVGEKLKGDFEGFKTDKALTQTCAAFLADPGSKDNPGFVEKSWNEWKELSTDTDPKQAQHKEYDLSKMGQTLRALKYTKSENVLADDKTRINGLIEGLDKKWINLAPNDMAAALDVLVHPNITEKVKGDLVDALNKQENTTVPEKETADAKKNREDENAEIAKKKTAESIKALLSKPESYGVEDALKDKDEKVKTRIMTALKTGDNFSDFVKKNVNNFAEFDKDKIEDAMTKAQAYITTHTLDDTAIANIGNNLAHLKEFSGNKFTASLKIAAHAPSILSDGVKRTAWTKLEKEQVTETVKAVTGKNDNVRIFVENSFDKWAELQVSDPEGTKDADKKGDQMAATVEALKLGDRDLNSYLGAAKDSEDWTTWKSIPADKMEYVAKAMASDNKEVKGLVAKAPTGLASYFSKQMTINNDIINAFVAQYKDAAQMEQVIRAKSFGGDAATLADQTAFKGQDAKEATDGKEATPLKIEPMSAANMEKLLDIIESPNVSDEVKNSISKLEGKWDKLTEKQLENAEKALCSSILSNEKKGEIADGIKAGGDYEIPTDIDDLIDKNRDPAVKEALEGKSEKQTGLTINALKHKKAKISGFVKRHLTDWVQMDAERSFPTGAKKMDVTFETLCKFNEFFVTQPKTNESTATDDTRWNIWKDMNTDQMFSIKSILEDNEIPKFAQDWVKNNLTELKDIKAEDKNSAMDQVVDKLRKLEEDLPVAQQDSDIKKIIQDVKPTS